MRNLQVSKLTLTNAGYSQPSQANTFYPQNNQTDHMHLGVPTSYLDNGNQRIAEEGNVFVTYISFKRNDAFWFRLDHNDHDGYFSFPSGHNANELPITWQTALRALGVVRGLSRLGASSSSHPMGWAPMEIVEAPVESYDLLAADAISDTPASGTETVPQQIADYTKWNEWLVAGGRLVETMDAILIKTISDPNAQNAINAACHSFYDAAQGMNKQIVAAIKDLEQTPPVQPTVEFPPSDLPDWADKSKPNLFSAIWDTAKPLLQMLDEKLVASHPNSPIVVALGGLIIAGDKIVQTLSTYYPEWGPQPTDGKN
jgi:hypothetical protein